MTDCAPCRPADQTSEPGEANPDAVAASAVSGDESAPDRPATRRNIYIRHVRFADCDPARIVFYPRFFELFDRATEELFHSVGFYWDKEFGANGLNGLPLVDASARFLSPAWFGDTLEIESWIDEWKGKVFVVEHRIRAGDREIAEGREVRVWAMDAPDRPSGIRAVPMPDEIRARFEQ